MKNNFINVSLIFIGGLFLLGGVSTIQRDILNAISLKEHPLKAGYFIACILFTFLGVYLVRLGYRKMNTLLEKESIDNIGEK